MAKMKTITLEDMYWRDISNVEATYEQDMEKITQYVKVMDALLEIVDSIDTSKKLANQIKDAWSCCSQVECIEAYKMGVTRGQEMNSLLNEVLA